MFESVLLREQSERDFSEPSTMELPGYKKKSFVLPYEGGEIWFEHLDGIYERTDLVVDKFRRDCCSFLAPSMPSQIAFVLFETLITEEIAQEIADVLCESNKYISRVCFVGADRRTERILRTAINDRNRFVYGFTDGFDLAKRWLISEP